MKKILFTCIAGFAMIGSTNLNAQSYWAGPPGTVQTTTTGNCGVGSNLAVGGTTSIGLTATDAKLHIKDPIYYDNVLGPANIPETRIDRIIYGTTIGNSAIIPNIFEIWQSQYTSPPNPTAIGTPSLLYVVNPAGNVGIANATPTYKLDVTGTIRASADLFVGGDIFMPRPTTDNTTRHLDALSTAGILGLHSNTSNNDGTSIEMYASGHSSKPGEIEFTSNGATSTSGGTDPIGFDFINYNSSASSLMRIYKNGKVAIGATDMTIPTGYGLYVRDGILTTKVKVAALNASGTWADFVFAPDYKLKSLNDVENFINKHKHLPDVPSAQEVSKNGIDIAEMDAKLLQKVEELTLYAIKQQKQIEDQQKQIEELRKGLNK